MSLWLSTLWYNGSQRFLEVDSDHFRKRIEFNWGLPHSIFLAVELFSTNVELPHIPSHFYGAQTMRQQQRGSSRFADQSCSGHGWGFVGPLPMRSWAPLDFRWLQGELATQAGCAELQLQLQVLGRFTFASVEETALGPWRARPLVTPVGFRTCSGCTPGCAVSCWGCGHSSHQGSLLLCELQLMPSAQLPLGLHHGALHPGRLETWDQILKLCGAIT